MTSTWLESRLACCIMLQCRLKQISEGMAEGKAIISCTCLPKCKNRAVDALSGPPHLLALSYLSPVQRGKGVLHRIQQEMWVPSRFPVLILNAIRESLSTRWCWSQTSLPFCFMLSSSELNHHHCFTDFVERLQCRPLIMKRVITQYRLQRSFYITTAKLP